MRDITLAERLRRLASALTVSVLENRMNTLELTLSVCRELETIADEVPDLISPADDEATESLCRALRCRAGAAARVTFSLPPTF